MAAISGHFAISVRDQNNTPAPITVYFTTSTGLIADADGALAAYLPLVDAVVGGQITGAKIVVDAALPGGLKSAPTAGVDNIVGALFDWRNTSNSDKFGVTYPGWYTANAGHGFDPAHPKNVNTADTAVAAFITGTDTPNLNTTITDEDGHPLSGYTSAIKSGRSYRRKLARAK